MGMVQSKKGKDGLFKIGCLARLVITKKVKMEEFLINLTGLTRFEILGEVDNKKLYREFKVDYKNFQLDLKNSTENRNIEGVT